jgi:uncharacterized protein (DUF433 family)
MRFEDYITIPPEIRSGKPCIKGTRITVADVLEYLGGGMTEAQILAEFPALKPEHIRACLGFAAARQRRLASGSTMVLRSSRRITTSVSSAFSTARLPK